MAQTWRYRGQEISGEPERLAAFRRIRDQIHERVKAFFRDRVAAAR